MKRKVAVGMALLAVIALAWFAWRKEPAAGSKEAVASAGALGWRALGGGSSVGTRAVGISGHVSSARGAALGARVCATCADCNESPRPETPRCVSTNPDGFYRIADLRLGSYRISASAPDHQPGFANEGRPIAIAGAELSQQDIVLDAGGARLRGVVLDAMGGPVAGARLEVQFVHALLPAGRREAQATQSDENGKFSLDVPNGAATLIASADGYAPSVAEAYAPSEDVLLTLIPAGSISGLVVLRGTGDPVSGVQVRALGNEAGDVAPSDEAGAFALRELRPGTYALDARGPGYIGALAGTVTLDLGESKTGVQIVVERAVSVSGQVATGSEPCATGTVFLIPAPGESAPNLEASTSPDGNVRFEAVPPGRYQSGMRCEGFGASAGPTLDVSARDVTGVRWQFPRGSDLTVHARSKNDVAVAGVWVRLRAEGATPGSPPRSMQADDRGAARFRGVTPGDYIVDAPSFAGSDMPARVSPHDDARELTLELRKSGAIEVVVEDARGLPNDRVAVNAFAVGKEPGGFGQARGAGRFLIPALTEAKYRVQVRDAANPARGGDASDGIVEVHAGEVTKVRVVYGGYRGVITGRVSDHAGAPAENVWVSVRPAGAERDGYDAIVPALVDGSSARRLTDRDGTFELGGLSESGTYTVIAEHSLGGQARASGVQPGKSVALTLNAPGKLSGVVLDARGRPAPSFQLQAENQGAQQSLVATFADAEGRFNLDHVAPGTVVLTALAAEGGGRTTLQLTAAQALHSITLRLAPHEPLAKTASPLAPASSASN